MVTKQQLVEFIDNYEYNDIDKDDIVDFFENDYVKEIGLAKGSFVVDDGTPKEFTGGGNLVEQLEDLKFGEELTVTFNTIAKPAVGACLLVIKYLIEEQNYEISEINSVKIVFTRDE